jgi:phosphoribosylformylglycinamidine synthase subunit PurL
VTAAHDLSDGGLAQALVESCLRHGHGARVELAGDTFVELFGESVGRAVVAVPAATQPDLEALCDAKGLPRRRIGVVDAIGPDAALEVAGQFTVPLAELRAAWTTTIPRAMGG